jgi:hypothetical protein
LDVISFRDDSLREIAVCPHEIGAGPGLRVDKNASTGNEERYGSCVLLQGNAEVSGYECLASLSFAISEEELTEKERTGEDDFQAEKKDVQVV